MAFLLCLVSLPMGLFAQAVRIGIQVDKPLKDTLFIGYYQGSGSRLNVTDTLLLRGGKGVLEKEKNVSQGVYFIKNGEMTFPFLMSSGQKFTLRINPSVFPFFISTEDSPENKAFFHYLDLQPDSLGANVEAERQHLTAAFGGSLLGKLMRGLTEVQIPDPPAALAGTVEEQIFRYQWYIDHYFDHLDYSDPDLFRTPIYDDRIKSYLGNVLPMHPDTVIVRTDRMLEKTRSNPEVFHHLASLLLSYYRGNDYVMAENVWVHIAERWFIPLAGEWQDSTLITDLSKEISYRKPNLVGAQAPDIRLATYDFEDFAHFSEGDSVPEGTPSSLKDLLTAKVNILFFWEAGCHYCLEAAPLLLAQMKDYDPSQVKVIAILTGDYPEGVQHWASTLKSLALRGWIHARSPKSARFKWDYNILNTPCLYLLDPTGKILIKNIGIEQTKEIVTMFLNS